MTDYRNYATDFMVMLEEYIKDKKMPVTTLRTELSLFLSKLLHNLKLPAHLPGYHYIKSAIIIIVLSEEKLPDLSFRLYEKIAQEFNTNKRHVERAIARAVKEINTLCDKEYILRTVLEYDVDPNNYNLNAKELIALIADQLRIKYGVLSN